LKVVQLFAVTESGPRSLPIPDHADNVNDLYDYLPVGVYTALCTFQHNKFLHLEDHLDRLDQSMELLDWDYRLDRVSLRKCLHQVCTNYPMFNARVRLDVLAEAAAILETKSRVLIGLSPFEPLPESLYEKGVRAGIASKLSRKQPQIKRAEFVFQRRKYIEENPDYYECLLVDEAGNILEGLTSNFYGVRGGMLWTAGQGMLEGIARKIVLQVAKELSIPVQFEPIRLEEVSSLDEAAISSSSRAIIPIIQIGDQVVGNGKPGPIIEELLEAYNAYVRGAIELAIDEKDYT
jgi:branched-chain amino acid aminotransferase